MPGGRPSMYSKELMEDICHMVATTSMGLTQLAERYDHFPCATIMYEWLGKHDEFADMYAKAKRQQISVYMDEITKISDDRSNDYIDTERGTVGNAAAVARDRLRVDTRKWLACKLVPKVFGDKSTVEIKTDLSAMTPLEIAEAVKNLSLDHKKAMIEALIEQMQQEIDSGK